MIHKEFIQTLSQNLKLSKAKTATYAKKLIDLILTTADKEVLNIDGFGKFHFHKGKKAEFDSEENLVKEINIK